MEIKAGDIVEVVDPRRVLGVTYPLDSRKGSTIKLTLSHTDETLRYARGRVLCFWIGDYRVSDTEHYKEICYLAGLSAPQDHRGVAFPTSFLRFVSNDADLY